jgi:hypothetical protein
MDVSADLQKTDPELTAEERELGFETEAQILEAYGTIAARHTDPETGAFDAATFSTHFKMGTEAAALEAGCRALMAGYSSDEAHAVALRYAHRLMRLTESWARPQQKH